MKKLIVITLVAALSLTAAGCSSKSYEATRTYGEEKAVGSGTINVFDGGFSAGLVDIIADVGDTIDYTADLKVNGLEDSDYLEIVVDSSEVDTDKAGTYLATYSVDLNGEKKEETIRVKVTEKEEATTKKEKPSKEEAETTTKKQQETTTKKQQETTTKKEQETTTKKQQETTTKKQQETTTKKEKETTTKKEHETTTKKQQSTESGDSIGSYTIELVSGKGVKVEQTTSHYIVRTYTDTTQVQKYGRTYNVSKLIVEYNNGDIKILETIESPV